jgi:hypothetical protein
MKLTLNEKLSFEFLDLKISKVEEFYSKRFQIYLFRNTKELTPEQKTEALLSGQIDGKSEFMITDNLSERTFIQGELVRSETYLNDDKLSDPNREKLNIWIDHLRQRVKAMTEIKQPKKSFDPLPDCFREKDDFYRYFNLFLKFYDIHKDGSYHWTGTKVQLAAIARRLKDKNKLIDSLKDGPDLSNVFCSLFNIASDPGQFRPNIVRTLLVKDRKFEENLNIAIN